MTIDHATTTITSYEQLVDAHAAALAAELDLEAEKPEAKRAAILRVLSETNPLTGKPHSATSAEAIVETDPAYAAFLRRRRDVIVERNLLAGRMEAARLRALLGLVAARRG